MEDIKILTEKEMRQGLSDLKSNQALIERSNEEKIKANNEAMNKLESIIASGAMNKIDGTKSIGVDMSYLKDFKKEDYINNTEKLLELKKRVFRDLSEILSKSKTKH